MATDCILCERAMADDRNALLCRRCYNRGQHEARKATRVSPNKRRDT